MKKYMRLKERMRAFTLLEVLMVVVILGVLVALIVPNFIGTGEGAKKDATAIKIKSLRTQLDLFKTHCGRYPSSEEGLNALVATPEDEQVSKLWRGPYCDVAMLKDSWGNDLIYKEPGEYNQTGYDLSSPGPNRVEGDDDDVTNWEKT